MQSLFQILMLLLDVVWFFIIAHVIMSWLINFQVLNLRQPLVAQIWDGLNRLLEPIYSRIRRILPAMGGIDLASIAYTVTPAEMNAAGEVVKEAVQIRYGMFIQKIIDFLIIAFAIFMLLKAYKSTQKPVEEAPAPDPGPSTEDLLAEIRDLLKKQ